MNVVDAFALQFEGVAVGEGEVVAALQVFIPLCLLLFLTPLVQNFLIGTHELQLCSQPIVMHQKLLVYNPLLVVLDILAIRQNGIDFIGYFAVGFLVHLVGVVIENFLLVLLLEDILLFQPRAHAPLNVRMQVAILAFREGTLTLPILLNVPLQVSFLLLLLYSRQLLEQILG